MKKLIGILFISSNVFGMGSGVILSLMPKSLSVEKVEKACNPWKVMPHDTATKMQSHLRQAPAWKVVPKEKILEQNPSKGIVEIQKSDVQPINVVDSFNPVTDSMLQHPDTNVSLSTQVIDLDHDQSYMSSKGYRVEFDAPMKLYVKHGSRGNLEALTFEEKRLEDKISNIKIPDFIKNTEIYKKTESYKNERRLSLIRKIKNHAATKALNTIQKDSLKKAWETLQAMRTEVYGPNSGYGQPDFQPLVNTSGPRITKYTVKNLQEAERSFYSRLDYQQMVKKQELETQALEKAKQAEQQTSIASKEVHLDSEQSQPLCGLEEMNLSNDTPYDLVQTTPSKVMDISPEINAKVTHELQSRITVDPTVDFEAHAKQMKDVLDDMQQRGELTLAQQKNLLANGIKTLLQKMHPSIQIEKRVLALKSAAQYLFETEFGHLYMSDEQIAQRFDQTMATFEGLRDIDFSKITAEQLMEFTTTIVADLPYDIGIVSGISYLQKIGTLGNAEQVLEKLPTHLQRAYKSALADHPALFAKTAEGIPVRVTEGLVVKAPQALEEATILKNTAEKIVERPSLPTLSEAKNKLAVHKEWFNLADKAEQSLSKTKPGSVTPMDITKYLKHEKEMEIVYEKIRQTNDISAIAKNTGLPEKMIQRIKKHVFFENHVLDEGFMRFAADGDMATAWTRLQENKALACDIMLLKHEFSESILLSTLGLNARQAHKLANQLYNWNQSYK